MSNGTAVRGPQRIVVLLDGTWNKRRGITSAITSGGVYTGTSAKWFTNVALLARCVLPSSSKQSANRTRSNPDAADGVPFPSKDYVMPQTTFYQDGIGTSPYIVAQLVEGATGSTLDLKVMEAYSFVVDNWIYGDELCLFGFSRGAYTARTLAALINYVGVLSRAENAAHLGAIWKAFRDRDASKPETVAHAEQTVFKLLGRWPSKNAMFTAQTNVQAAKILVEAGDVPPPIMLMSQDEEPSESEQQQQQQQQQQRRNTKQSGGMPFGNDERTPSIEPPTIQVVGVWDTVGALGIPGIFPNPQKAQFYSFFDPMLAPNVRNAFHALALSEDRKDFLPTIWALPKHELPEDAKRRQGQQLKQCWFQGSHGDVGGGHPWHGLSDVAFAWMIAQLVDHPSGSLLDIDVGEARKLQDFRLPWARQPQHPSRAAIEFQATRYVCGWSVPDALDKTAVWRNIVDRSATHESIHHSVVVGQQYDPSVSLQFTLLRAQQEKDTKNASAKATATAANVNDNDNVNAKSDGQLDVEAAGSLSQNENGKRLEQMWHAAQDPESLSKTEKELLWSADECHQPDQSMTNPTNDSEKIPIRDEELPPRKPENMNATVWKVVKGICYAPLIAISSVSNWKVILLDRKTLPQSNLEPPSLLKYIQSKEKRPQQPSIPLFK